MPKSTLSLTAALGKHNAAINAAGLVRPGGRPSRSFVARAWGLWACHLVCLSANTLALTPGSRAAKCAFWRTWPVLGLIREVLRGICSTLFKALGFRIAEDSFCSTPSGSLTPQCRRIVQDTGSAGATVHDVGVVLVHHAQPAHQGCDHEVGRSTALRKQHLAVLSASPREVDPPVCSVACGAFCSGCSRLSSALFDVPPPTPASPVPIR